MIFIRLHDRNWVSSTHTHKHTIHFKSTIFSFLIINSHFFQSLCIHFQMPLIICYFFLLCFFVVFFLFVKFTCFHNQWMQIMWNVFHSWQAQLSHFIFFFCCLSFLMKSSTKRTCELNLKHTKKKDKINTIYSIETWLNSINVTLSAVRYLFRMDFRVRSNYWQLSHWLRYTNWITYN